MSGLFMPGSKILFLKHDLEKSATSRDHDLGHGLEIPRDRPGGLAAGREQRRYDPVETASIEVAVEAGQADPEGGMAGWRSDGSADDAHGDEAVGTGEHLRIMRQGRLGNRSPESLDRLGLMAGTQR
ncbi:MAG: hypothetical protein J0J15_22005, partial [Mesorhizobium sp.]|nr:hypothetical protein [Mesorhizobium sp.]